MVFISISGKELGKLLEKKGGHIFLTQEGSHMKYRNINSQKTIIIPDHKEIKEGLLNKILKDIAEQFGKSKTELFKELFQ